jgi:ketosteroid isomerase-like protein
MRVTQLLPHRNGRPDAGLLVPPRGATNTGLLQGRAIIEEFWRHAIERARAAGAVRTIALDEVTSSGGLGYALGTVTVRIPTGRQLTTKYATIWQRAADGRWQLAVDSSSPNPPQTPSR